MNVVGPSRSTIFMNIQAVIGLLLAWALLDEGIGVWQITGAAFVLGGVALTTRKLPSFPRAQSRHSGPARA